MAISKEKLQHQRNIRLLRENRELTLQKEKQKSQLAKPMVDLGTTEKPVPSRGVVQEGDHVFDQETETFSDRTDLLSWIDDLVDEWGVEPTFDDIWAAMKKEPRKLGGFVDSMGMGQLKFAVQQEADIRAKEANHPSMLAWEEEPMYEAPGDDTWKKSKDRRDERKHEIEKGVLKEEDGETATVLANRALKDALGANETIKQLANVVNVVDDIFEVRAIGLRDPHKIVQLTRRARMDARALVESLKAIVKSLPSEVVAEEAPAEQEACEPTTKTNLDKVLEACSMDEEEETK